MENSKKHLLIRGDNGLLSKSCIWVESNNFYGDSKISKNSKNNADSFDPFVVIGFDTEYKTPSEPLNRLEIEQGLGRNKILSYQVYCKLYDPAIPDQPEWGARSYRGFKGSPQNSEKDRKERLLPRLHCCPTCQLVEARQT